MCARLVIRTALLSSLLLRNIQLLAATQSDRQHPLIRNNAELLGGYREVTDITGNVFLQNAAAFAFEQYVAGLSSYPYSFTKSRNEGEANHLAYEIVSAQQQLVAGMNYDILLKLTREEDGQQPYCLGGFHVIVYDNFGVLGVTSWGKEISCDHFLIVQQEKSENKDTEEDVIHRNSNNDNDNDGAEMTSIEIKNFCFTQEGEKFSCTTKPCKSNEDCSSNTNERTGNYYLGCSSSQTCHDMGACCTKVDG